MSAVVEACLSAKEKTGLNHRLSFQKKAGNYLTQRSSLKAA
jgi:hypothetical protein